MLEKYLENFAWNENSKLLRETESNKFFTKISHVKEKHKYEQVISSFWGQMKKFELVSRVENEDMCRLFSRMRMIFCLLIFHASKDKRMQEMSVSFVIAKIAASSRLLIPNAWLMAKDKDSRHIRTENRHLIVNLVNRPSPWYMIDESSKLQRKKFCPDLLSVIRKTAFHQCENADRLNVVRFFH